MTFYDYKVAPAPRQLKRVKGVKSAADLLCLTLAETINAAAREGWEYLRADTLSAQEEGGFFRRGGEVVETVLVFRRPRESLGPRLASPREAAPVPAAEPAVPPLAVDRAARERALAMSLRREPRLTEGPDSATTARPAPRLGPADPG